MLTIVAIIVISKVITALWQFLDVPGYAVFKCCIALWDPTKFGCGSSLSRAALTLDLSEMGNRETKRQSTLREFHLPSSHFEVQCPGFSSLLKVGLSNQGHSPGAYICYSLWDRAAEDVGCPSLAAEALVLSQTIVPDRGQGGEVIVLFFPSPMRQRLQVQVKVNYEFHPWQNPIINFTLPEMPLEVGFALFGMQTDSFCLWCIQEDISIKDSLTMGAHSDLHFNSFSLSADMQLIFQGQTPISPDISCLRIMLIIY